MRGGLKSVPVFVRVPTVPEFVADHLRLFMLIADLCSMFATVTELQASVQGEPKK